MSKAERSHHMSLVKGKNTRFELKIMRYLSSELYPLGYRYRKHHRTVKGTPDVVFVRQRIAIFFDSDFWHGRNYARMKPRMNAFWRAKIERNMQRDREVDEALREEGWTVLRFGETESKKDPNAIVRQVRSRLKKADGRTRSRASRAGAGPWKPLARPTLTASKKRDSSW
jgi:DNA mismatch endonuclease, patch repair protein